LRRCIAPLVSIRLQLTQVLSAGASALRFGSPMRSRPLLWRIARPRPSRPQPVTVASAGCLSQHLLSPLSHRRLAASQPVDSLLLAIALVLFSPSPRCFSPSPGCWVRGPLHHSLLHLARSSSRRSRSMAGLFPIAAWASNPRSNEPRGCIARAFLPSVNRADAARVMSSDGPLNRTGKAFILLHVLLDTVPS